MNTPCAPDQVEQFRSSITRHLGLQFDDAKLGLLAEVLGRAMERTSLSCEAYLARLQSGTTGGEAGLLAQELTVAETYFFRNIDQFHALALAVLPQRLQARHGQSQLHALSAGCASGEEAYTIAMVARQALAGTACSLSVRAVDINPAVLEKARRARYTDWSLRETPADARQRWFRPAGREVLLDDEIRQAVTFEERNLVADDLAPWPAGLYDVVFCRNVLMYLAPAQAQAVVARIARALAPGGYLFLGHAETLRNLSQDFHLLHTHGTFYYQRKLDDEMREAPALMQTPVQALVQASAASIPATAAVQDDTWVETIRKASERIERIARAPEVQPATAAATLFTPATAPWDPGQALDLLHQERFADALDLVRAAPAQAARAPDTLLLHAVLLTHGGRLQEAEATCRQLLAQDELNAGAHYVLALCREGSADIGGAVDHNQVAAYLDPAFAMPRLHLGLLARRAGNREAARRELGQALVLLQREDASRLLLFGGGFGRDMLLALCRAQLQACGGQP